MRKSQKPGQPKAKRAGQLSQDPMQLQSGRNGTWKGAAVAAPRPVGEQYVKALEAFKKKHGHCNVPRIFPSNQSLGYWVDRMRRRRREGKLDEQTIRRLDKLGFCWSLLERRFHRRDLDEFVARVRDFKKRHGHCNIALHEGADEDLVNWRKDVRKSRKHGRLDPKYVRQLEKLGFAWERRKTVDPKAMYAALLAYRKRYGDCNVPYEWPQDVGLARWVSRMRAARKRNGLTRAEIRQYDKIGFAWDGTAWRDRRLDERLKELAAFRKKHGHCKVPADYAKSPGLGKWVAQMRWQKKAGKLARETVRRLNAAGFCWQAREAKKPLRKPKKTAARAKKARR